MIVNKAGTHLGTAPHRVQIFRQPQTRPNPLDEVQPADLAQMIRQPQDLGGEPQIEIEANTGIPSSGDQVIEDRGPARKHSYL